MNPFYIDPNSVLTNRVPDGFAQGWQVNVTPILVPPGTAVFVQTTTKEDV
jgi:hypothetical protein